MRRLAVMNLALHGIAADFGPKNAVTFHRDRHPYLRAEYVLANPPFNDSDWFRKDDYVRCSFIVSIDTESALPIYAELEAAIAAVAAPAAMIKIIEGSQPA